MKHKFISRTCGSVRSSLSAPARLVTVGAEAAETTFLHHQDEATVVRRSPRLRASTRLEGQGWMTGPTQVNCSGHRKIQRAKDADRLKPKGNAASVLQPYDWSTRTTTAAGVKAGAKSFMSWQSNIATLTFRLPVEAGVAARNADGMAGRGCWKKQRPFCNGTDRGSNIALPCKRAYFQRVVRDETAGRTFMGGNRK